MLKFNTYLVEQQNTHLEHIEDELFNHGVKGARKSINFLRDIRNMLAGHEGKHISASVKFDGAPAIFAGVDPRDGKFFVAKKGIFNKNPKIYKTAAEIKADTKGDLSTKLIMALNEFSKLGIKPGVVYQGDLMFTHQDLKKESIDGESYVTFHPNTIVYAVPIKSKLGRQIAKAKIGIVWHTSYEGKDFQSMSASFGKPISNKLKNVSSVWHHDATYKDVSGTATLTKAETEHVTSILSRAGKLFNKIPGSTFDDIHKNPELLIRLKTYNNMFIREGKPVNLKTHVKGLTDYIYNYYQKQIDSKKQEKTKKAWADKRKDVMSYFNRHSKADITKLFELMLLMVDAKSILINKMNQAGHLKTFLRTKNGFAVTGQEGFVAIDHLSDGAVKLVDRMEFSKANFSPEFIKGWEK